MIISTTTSVGGRDYYARAEVIGDPCLAVLDVIEVVRHGRKIPPHHLDYGQVCFALCQELHRQINRPDDEAVVTEVVGRWTLRNFMKEALCAITSIAIMSTIWIVIGAGYGLFEEIGG